MSRKTGSSGNSKRTARSGPRRSAFREEFYQDRRPFDQEPSAPKRAVKTRARRHRRAVSVWLPVFGLSFMFCILAVAGSSAMIWLRKLGALFGVEWAGDG